MSSRPVRPVRSRALAAKASKRAARQLVSGALPDEGAFEALGWSNVDDSVVQLFDAAEKAEAAERAAGLRRKPRSVTTVSVGWSTVTPDSAALLHGASEGGFFSLEELAPELVFDARSLGKPAGARPAPVAAAAEEAPPARAAKKPRQADRSAAAEPLRSAAATTAKPAAKPAAKAAVPAAPATQLSKTRRRRLLRKKQSAAGDAAPVETAAAAVSGPSEPSAAAATGFEKPPSKRKRKRLATEAAAAAVAAAEAPSAVPLSAVEAGWAGLGLHPSVLAGLARLGFSAPTRIQGEVLPVAAAGRDVIGAARTGSGKTLAFGLPILDYCCRRAADDFALAALVLCPTRELALQVASHLAAAGRPAGVRCAALVGGLAAAKQQRLLSRRPAIVVATPGRLWELAQAGEPHLAALHALRFLVLDEADRMVEKGHFAELEAILDAVEGRAPAAAGPADVPVADAGGATSQALRQTFVFSATLTIDGALRKRLSLRGGAAAVKGKPRRAAPSAVGALLERVPFARKPRIIDCCGAAPAHASASAHAPAGLASALEEAAMEGSDEGRDAALVYLLSSFSGRSLVFCNAISTVRRVAAILATLRIPCAAIHASQQQRQRLKALDRFAAAGGEQRLALVATDVAARGLDIPGVRTVIHYQVAPSADVYVHRSGRTARAMQAGLAVTLVTPGERSRYAALCRSMGRPDGLPSFPADAALLAAAARRALLAVKLDALVHAREKRAGDVAWARRHAAECDIALSDDDELAAGGDEPGDGERAGGKLAPSARERELRGRLDAMLAVPLVSAGKGGGAAGGSRKYPHFETAPKEAARPDAPPKDALEAVLASKKRRREGRVKEVAAVKGK